MTAGNTIDTTVTQVTIATVDYSQFTTSHTFEINPSIYDFTGYGKTWARNRAGLKKGTLSLGGLYADGSTDPPKSLRAIIGTTVAFVYGPEGSATGKPKMSGSCVIGKYDETGKIDDQIAWSVDLTFDDTVTIGVYP